MTTSTERAKRLAEPEPSDAAPVSELHALEPQPPPAAGKPVLRTDRVRTRIHATQRMIVVADALALSVSFLLASVLVSERWTDYAVFLAALPAWVVGARLLGL